MEERKKIIWIISGAALLIVVVIVVAGYFSFFKKGADQPVTSEYISNKATVSYTSGNGQSSSLNSNVVAVKKVSLFPLAVSLKGRSSGQVTVNVDFIGQTNGATEGKVKAVLGSNGGNIMPDWTTINLVNIEAPYDLRVSSNGFLSRKIADIVPGQQTSQINVEPLRPGDLNQDHKIDINDYVSWKLQYGKSGQNMAEDFNGDGKVDIFDFGMSFGSRCYNATENNQDVWCNQ